VPAPGASDGDRLVARSVQVEKQSSGDERRVEVLGSVEPLLLGHREEQLERAVRDLGVVRDGQRSRDPDAVVRSEGRPFRDDPVAVDDDIESSFARVVWAIRVTLAHHVQVCLEDDRGPALPPSRTRHLHDDIALVVNRRLEAALCCPAENVLPRFRLLLRRPRDQRQLREAGPDAGRLQTGERAHLRNVKAAPAKRSKIPARRGQLTAIRSTPNQPFRSMTVASVN